MLTTLSTNCMGPLIGKNNNTRTVQAESSKFASVLFNQGFQIWVGWNWLERHLSVFCIDPIVPGFVVYYVNSSVGSMTTSILMS